MTAITRRLSSVVGLVFTLFLLAACASTGPNNKENAVNDPIEPFNRAMFTVNDVLDTAVIRPVALGYNTVIPEPVRDMVTNFLRWLHSPVILANDLLQGDWPAAQTTFSRFIVNGVLLGFVELGEGLGLPYRREDFGQTMAVHGAEEGPYLVLPLLGPTTARDALGKVVDYFLDPLNYSWVVHPTRDIAWARRGAEAVDFRSRNFEQIDELKAESLDYYAKVRSIYRQKRKAEINNGEPVIEEKQNDMSEDLDKLFLESEPEAETGERKPANN